MNRLLASMTLLLAVLSCGGTRIEYVDLGGIAELACDNDAMADAEASADADTGTDATSEASGAVDAGADALSEASADAESGADATPEASVDAGAEADAPSEASSCSGSASIRQVVSFAIASGSAVPSVTIDGVLAGDTLYAVFVNGGNDTTVAVSDGVNTYTRTDTVTGAPYHGDAFVASIATAGNYTIKGSAAESYPWGVVVELSGVASLDGHAIAYQSNPGTVANALRAGPPSPENANAPTFIVGTTFQANNGGGGNGDETMGSGFVGSNYNPWGGTTNAIAVESRTLASGSAGAATFTAGGSGGADYISTEAVFDSRVRHCGRLRRRCGYGRHGRCGYGRRRVGFWRRRHD